MPLSLPRIVALFMLIAVLAWIPGAAADWLGSPRPGQGPYLIYTTAPEGATTGEPYDLGPPRPTLQMDDVPQRIDLRGNEIVRPVARYGVDHRGALFDMHSPETEVPKLSPPEL